MAQYTFDTLFDYEFSKIVLPSGYTKLNYIRTNKVNTFDIIINYVCSDKSIITTYYNYIGGSSYRYYMGNINANGWSLIGYSNNNFTDSKKAIVDCVQKKIFYENGGIASISIDSTEKIRLFTSYRSYWSSTIDIEVKEIEIEEDNNDVCLLIPASNGSDLGLYDIENDIFYTNNGTGTFTSGGIAPTYSFQNGDEIIISQTKTHYHYQDGDLVFYYQEMPSLVFKGITFEQTDYWQKPEMVFRGFSFEELFVKKSNISLFHGMS